MMTMKLLFVAEICNPPCWPWDKQTVDRTVARWTATVSTPKQMVLLRAYIHFAADVGAVISDLYFHVGLSWSTIFLSLCLREILTSDVLQDSFLQLRKAAMRNVTVKIRRYHQLLISCARQPSALSLRVKLPQDVARRTGLHPAGECWESSLPLHWHSTDFHNSGGSCHTFLVRGLCRAALLLLG